MLHLVEGLSRSVGFVLSRFGGRRRCAMCESCNVVEVYGQGERVGQSM